MSGFQDTVAAWIQQTQRKIDLFVIAYVTLIGERLIYRSPIGNPLLWKHPAPANYKPGQFISNWNLGLNAADLRTTEETDVREVNGLSRMPARAAGQRYYITNSLPYAFALEHGHSLQAPLGIVGLTVIEARSLAAEALASVH